MLEKVLHHDVSLSVAGGLEPDDLKCSFQPKLFFNNTARNVCTVQILILQTDLQPGYEEILTSVFLFSEQVMSALLISLCLCSCDRFGAFLCPSWGAFPSDICIYSGPSICSLPLRTTVLKLPNEMSWYSAGAQL